MNRGIIQYSLLVFVFLNSGLISLSYASNAREAQGDEWFEAIMAPQNQLNKAAVPPRYLPSHLSNNLANDRDDPPVLPSLPGFKEAQTVTPRAQVDLPLSHYSKMREQLQALRRQADRSPGPAVVLGESEFSGRAIPGALSLKVRLQVTLGREGVWKTVPLIGDDVVLVSAQVNGERLAAWRRNGYHVWLTKLSGEKTVELEVLVPARGPRGSIEYDFLVARTPVMRFSCSFPATGLEPRLDTAVESTIQSKNGQTFLNASLRPTTHIHLVGFRDLGEQEQQTAKVYSESMNLLSVDEGALELFSVVRYSILYAGTKTFQLLLPKGMSVVSADGEGAFRFVLEKAPNGNTLLKGETAFPIRNSYEVSLRLRRDLDRKGESFAVPLPRCLNVERETGWLGVEVPGKLKLEEVSRDQVVAVDVRQIPPEMIHSAVSPILKAYRYHNATANVKLVATRLPEKEPEAGSVDQLRAITVISPEGRVLSHVRVTLRNRLMHSLALKLPPKTKVLSTHLEGRPIKPSRDEQKRLLLTLKRSAGGNQLRPFNLDVVLESDLAARFGWFGRRELILPAVDLPVASLAWSVYLPAKNSYSILKGSLARQNYVGQAHWLRPPVLGDVSGSGNTVDDLVASGTGGVETAMASDSGAMPVRIAIPRSGIELTYKRYWIEKSQPIKVGFWFLRSWLRIPIGLLLILLMTIGLTLAIRPAGAFLNRLQMVGFGLFLLTFWPLLKIGGVKTVILGVVLSALSIGMHRGIFGRGLVVGKKWIYSSGLLYAQRKKNSYPSSILLWKVLCGAVMGIFSIALIITLTQLIALLFNPLP